MSSESSPPVVPQAPRRDKFAAMTGRSAAASVASGTQPAAAATTTTTPATTTTGTGRGSKFAAMAAQSRAQAVASEEEKIKAEISIREERLRGIEEKMSKREKLLKDLDRAEDLTCTLVEIAHRTTKALEDLSCAPNISALAQQYRETLRELHPLLSIGTEEFIQPYQNHSTETRQSMYAARVEMRLAKERTKVLKIVTDLERNQRQGESRFDSAESREKKRLREE